MFAFSEERRSVHEYNALYPSLYVLLRFISQFTSNRLNLSSARMEVSADFDQITFCCFFGELRWIGETKPGTRE